MKAQETLTLIRPSAKSVWKTAHCVLWSRPTRHPKEALGLHGPVDDVVLNIETVGDEIKGNEEYTPRPSAVVSWFMNPFSANELVGKTFQIPKAFDQRVRDHLVDMVYYEHMDVDDNRVEFIARHGDTFHVRWTGVMEDNSPPKGSPPHPTIQVVADFSTKMVKR